MSPLLLALNNHGQFVGHNSHMDLQFNTESGAYLNLSNYIYILFKLTYFLNKKVYINGVQE